MLACSQPDKRKKIDFSGESNSRSRVAASACAGRAQRQFFGVPDRGFQAHGALAKDEYDDLGRRSLPGSGWHPA